MHRYHTRAAVRRHKHGSECCLAVDDEGAELRRFSSAHASMPGPGRGRFSA
jgi:hypothetical protein